MWVGGWVGRGGGGGCGDGPKDDNTEGVSGSADSRSCNLPVRPSPNPVPLSAVDALPAGCILGGYMDRAEGGLALGDNSYTRDACAFRGAVRRFHAD